MSRLDRQRRPGTVRTPRRPPRLGWAAALLLAVSLVVALPSDAADAGAAEELPPLGRSEWPCPHWAMYGRVVSRTFAYDCPSAISPATAHRLVPLWTFKTDKTVTASPVVADGVVYVGDWSNTMYALDADDGTLRWRRTLEPAPGAPFGPIVSSAAVADVDIGGVRRRLVIVGAGPRLYALDAGDGSVVWVHYYGAGVPDEQTEVESSPVVWDGVVYVGMDVHNRTVEETGGVRGGVFAHDAATGQVRWYFNPELDNVASGCSSVWSSPTLDVRRGLVFFGTGNCPHDDYPWTPFTEAVGALRMSDGTPVWSFQPHPPNRDDLDFGATANLFRDRSGREVLGIGNKDATYYALDPATGALLWATTVAEPGVVMEDFSIGGFIGSTATGRGDVFGATAIGGAPYYHALDGRDGRILWQGVAGPSYAASATVNGVVIAGALDNELKVWEARSGRLLWTAPLLGPISSGPAVVGDRIYVGSGTSSSDACAKDTPIVSDLCFAAFEEALGRTGAVHAFALAAPGHLAATTPGAPGILLGAEGNRLWAYDTATLTRQVLLPSAEDAPAGGLDTNGQICGLGGGRFLAGEDTGQDRGRPPGWGVFRLHGTRVGELTASLTGRLVPTYQASSSNPENYGCGVLSDGRVVTTDVGDQFPGTPANGQLILWFPPFEGEDIRYCKIDVAIPTAGGVWVDDQDRVYVAANRSDGGRTAGIWRYHGDWPTGPDAAGGCGRTDPTGAPLVDDGRIGAELVVPADAHVVTPSAVVPSGRGTFYVSSVANGVVAEYDTEGRFLRRVVDPPGPPSETTGTPFGLAVGADGTLYYADLGIVGVQPAPGYGTVRRVRFEDGTPTPPETLHAGLDFPDGLGFVSLGTPGTPPTTPPPPPAAPAAPLPATGGGTVLAGLLLAVVVARRRHGAEAVPGAARTAPGMTPSRPRQRALSASC